jgi:lipoate-protein ligase B
MNVQYLGRIPFGDAESKQRRLNAPSVLGFESEPTVSVGRRANSTDLLWSAERWSELGFQVHAAERGGQATIHNPGQLICFVSQDIRALGVRGFVCLLKKATENFLLQNGVASYWRDDAPGLYTPAGKIMSLGASFNAT